MCCKGKNADNNNSQGVNSAFIILILFILLAIILGGVIF
jgi:hypothetical protein